MPVYYFHLRNAQHRVLDSTGRQLDGMDAVKAAALQEARGVIAEDVKTGKLDLRHTIDVEDGSGNRVYRLDLRDAVEIVGLDGPIRASD